MMTSQSQPSSSPDTLGADDSGFPYMTLENIQPINVPEINYALDLFDMGNFDSSETSSGLINIPLISMTSIPLYSINSPAVGGGKTINMLSIEDATLRPLNGQGKVSEMNSLDTMPASVLQKKIDDALAAGTKEIVIDQIVAIARGETEIILNKMIDIRPGEMLDGRGITIIAGPLFEEVAKLNNTTASKLVRIEDGSLQNVNFTGINDTAPADGIHAYGNYANIDNVHFDTIGSDAITGQNIKNLTITNSSFTGAEDKVIRISAATNIVIDNVTSYDNGANSSFLRINGGKDYDGGILTITNSDINNAKGVVGIDDTGQGYTISNTENTNNIHGTPWKDIYSTAPVNPTTVAPEDITSLNNSKT